MLSTAESLPSLSLANATEFSSQAVTIHPEAIELVRRSQLSPSTMNDLNGKCAAKWAVGYLTPRDDDPWSPAGAGTLVHAGLEDFYGLDPSERTQRRLYVLLQDQARQAVSRIRGSAEAAALSTWKWGRTPDYDLGEGPAPAPEPLGFTPEEVGADARSGRDVIGEAFVETDELAEHLWALACGIFDIEDPKAVSPVGSEVTVGGVELGGVPVNGQIDRVDELSDGTVEVIDYKGLALDTPIPTPDGWTVMGDLDVGDQVLGSGGHPINVTVKSQIHHRPCYRIYFYDGSWVDCDNVHLWSIRQRLDQNRTEEAVVEADELYSRFTEAVQQGRSRSIQIPNPKPLNLPEADLPVSPYVLGVWLGDGRTRESEITSGNQDIDEMARLLSAEWGESFHVVGKGSRASRIVLGKPHPGRCPMGNDCGRWGAVRRCADCRRLYQVGPIPRAVGDNVSLSTLLRRNGFLGNKHIPISYQRASFGQRLALLQGLMDTDGHWNPKRRRAVFTTSLSHMADAVAELVSGLGVTPQRFSGENGYRGFQIVEFTPAGFNPFRLDRKRTGAQVSLDDPKRRTHAARHRVIKYVEPIESVPTQCIKVDAEDELYLCGPLMTLTHNTGAKARGVTGPYRHDYAWQMRVYALAYEALTGITVSSARIFFTRLGKEVSVRLSKPNRAQTLKELTTAWGRHDEYTTTGVFPTEVSPLCGWCPLVNLCPAASEAGIGLSERAEVRPFSPRAERMPSGAELVALESASASDSEDSAEEGSAEEESGHSHTVNDAPTDGDDSAMTVRRDQLTGELPPYIAEGEDENGRVTFESNSWAANNLYRLFIEADRLVADSELTDDDAEFFFELMVNTVASATDEHSGVANPQAGIFTRFKDTLVTYAWVNNPANADDPAEWMESAISHLLTRAQIVEDTYFRLAFDTEEADKEAA